MVEQCTILLEKMVTSNCQLEWNGMDIAHGICLLFCMLTAATRTL